MKPNADFPDLNGITQKIGYHFKDELLLRTAFMHTSYVNEHPTSNFVSNQRLEYLGDAVVELAVTNELFERLPTADEGRLSAIRAKLVCTDALAYAAQSLGLSSYLVMGKGADLTGERENPTVLEDAFEALAGAVYLDGGYRRAEKFVKKALAVQIMNATEAFTVFSDVNDNKTSLQIKLQKNGPVNISYSLTAEEGPPHDRTFYVSVMLDEKTIGTGTGRSKKEAEQNAAKQALESIS